MFFLQFNKAKNNYFTTDEIGVKGIKYTVITFFFP